MQGSAYDYFKQAVSEPALLDECGLDDSTKKILIENIQRKLTQQAVKIRADFEVSCYTYEGIDAVKVTGTFKKNLVQLFDIQIYLIDKFEIML